jgi:ferredoxin
MKKLAVKDQNACMACLNCEISCAQAFYKGEDIIAQNLSCVQIGSKENKVKVIACVQCGKCAKICEVKAITKNAKGVYVLDKKACVDCGKCVEECPFGLIVKAKKQKSPSKCIACGICVKNCPMDVLFIKEDTA